MTNLRPFQIGLLSVFALLAILSIYFVKVYNPPSSNDDLGYGDKVVIWGMLDQTAMKNAMNQIVLDDPDFSKVEYYEIDPREFDDELVNAIAEGRSPDLVMLRSDALVKHRAKLLPIPFDTISARDFRDAFVDGAEIYMMSNGVYAIPFAVDPLVMYWNRDLFASAGLAQAPTTWESLVGTVAPALTVRDTSRNLIQSAVAFGEHRNVNNAKAVLLALTMQSGSKMVTETDRGYQVSLDKPIEETGRPPMDAALQFFTDFSNAASPLYTWNRAQPSDLNAFVSEDLAIYFGLGSEAKNVANKNPNLNFDVAPIPQGASATTKRTYGDFYGLAIPNAATNKNGAYAAALKLTSNQYSAFITSSVNLASPRRSIITIGETSPYRQVVLQSSLIARSWLDPEPTESDRIFGEMVEDVVSSRARVSSAVLDAVRKLSLEY